MHAKYGPLAYSKRETAYLLGISERLLDQLLQRGKIQSFRIGKRVLVSRSALLAFLRGTSCRKERGQKQAKP